MCSFSQRNHFSGALKSHCRLVRDVVQDFMHSVSVPSQKMDLSLSSEHSQAVPISERVQAGWLGQLLSGFEELSLSTQASH